MVTIVALDVLAGLLEGIVTAVETVIVAETAIVVTVPPAPVEIARSGEIEPHEVIVATVTVLLVPIGIAPLAVSAATVPSVSDQIGTAVLTAETVVEALAPVEAGVTATEISAVKNP